MITVTCDHCGKPAPQERRLNMSNMQKDEKTFTRITIEFEDGDMCPDYLIEFLTSEVNLIKEDIAKGDM